MDWTEKQWPSAVPNCIWTVDDQYHNILVNEMTGRVLKRVSPTHLPDGTIMDTLTPFQVEASREITNGTVNVKKGTLIIAQRFPDGMIFLFCGSLEQPIMVSDDAVLNEDFVFLNDLTRVTDDVLDVKLQRVLEIENYEMAAEIRDELAVRKKKNEPKASNQ